MTGQKYNIRAENQSGTGAPHSKVRPERLTGKIPAMPLKFTSIEQP
jgi:hypothetical protein